MSTIERATLVATLTAAPADRGPTVLETLQAEGVEVLEVRADLVGDLDPGPLRARFAGRLLYTLRSRTEGGGFDGTAERRRRRLLDAAERYDFIDLEGERDLAPELLAAVPAERRILSWHGPSTDLATLKARFDRLATVPARLYKLVPTAVQAGDELPALLLLHSLRRRDVIAFASGASGAWTRLLAPRLGAPVVYGAAGSMPGAPGQMSISRLRSDYGLPDLPPVTTLFGLVGNPVFHSLSPRLHNGAYRELGIPALYVPFHVASFGDFWLEVVESGVLDSIGFGLRGLSVTAPYKEAALAVAGAESPLAGRIGAANTLVWNQGVWEAESTDPEGVVLPLTERGFDPRGMRVAVVGTGGGGRSAAVGLACAGAEVTLANRGSERGERAAADLQLPYVPLADLDPAAYDLLVNATALGRRPSDPLPFAVDAVRPGAVVLDLVYDAENPGPTRLLTAAEARGAVAVEGREVLLSQALGQFRMMTRWDLPPAVARRLLGMAEPVARPSRPPRPLAEDASPETPEDLGR